MALVACEECGKSISSAAPACIHCGLPRGAAPVPESATAAAPILIEQTSKEWKQGMLIGALTPFGGLLIGSLFGDQFGYIVFALSLAIGGVIFVRSLFGAWWNHA